MKKDRYIHKKTVISLAAAAALLGASVVLSAEAPSGTRALVQAAEESGMTLYWDTLTSSGLIEKNGHQVSFQGGERLVMLDSSALALTDAPLVQNGEIIVSDGFLELAEEHFSTKPERTAFRVGAILIDPGHGGKDPGASQSFTIKGKKLTVTEKDVTLSIGKMLYARLKQAYPDKQIIMTRDTDVFLTLGQRTDIANAVRLPENEAVLYVSVHVNASLDKKASGYEVWYLSPGYRRTVLDKSAVGKDDGTLFPILNSIMEEEYTTESILIAKFIMDGLQAQIGSQSKARGIKAEEWFVVRNANMPSVLIEVGFLTNEAEAVNLSTEAYLQKTAFGIYNGVQAFVTHFVRSRGLTSTK
ncbi:MAG: N-acetylmuramoyl-L-alanine amidase [Treponemataceae bacterium]|nr:N-acetylmuramoyl-L-alanine amidase [Treponemataceae bacterium]